MKIILSHPCIVPCPVRYNTSRMARIEPRYVTPSYEESGDADFFDPSELGYPPEMEAADAQYYDAGMGVVPAREEVIGRVATFSGGAMALVDQFIRRVLVTHNPRTGTVHFMEPDDDAPFGWDQAERYPVEQTWNQGEVQEEGTFAYAAEQPGARAPSTDVFAMWRKNGGEPTRRSSFKYPHLGLRRHPVTNSVVAGGQRQSRGA